MRYPKKYDISNHPILKLKEKNRIYLVKRLGKCNPTKCNSLCCKIQIFDPTEYHKYSYLLAHLGITGRGKKIKFKDGIKNVYFHPCLFLKNNKCSINNNKPLACKLFPTPFDNVYRYVRKKCGYRFKFLSKKKHKS
jgi:Fe-S-cluster containining protein